MLKKAGAVAAAAAGLMLLASPAFATPSYDLGHYDDGATHNEFDQANFFADGGEEHDQVGLVNFGEDSDILSNFNICQIEVPVIAVPILSHNDESACVTSDDDDNDSQVAVDGDDD
jgi:hypothetical protein